MDQFRVEDALLPGRAEAEQLIRQEPVPSQQPFVPRGFWGQIGQHFAQGTYQSLAKYFGIADKIGLTTPLTEPEFNALKGARDMPFRPGFSQQTWENEIDAHDVGYIIDQLEKRGLDNNFSMVIGSVLGGFTDPVNVAGTYLTPMVGAANLLSRGALMRLVEKAGPEAVVKYLASNPSGFMQVTKRAAIFGAAEGIAEIPADKYFSELTGQREYTVADAGLNVLTGAALNVAITGVDIGLSKAMANLQRRFKKTEAETSQFAAATSAKSINDLTPVTVSEVEANVAKMQTYQPEGKKQVVRTDGQKAIQPSATTPLIKQVNISAPDVVHENGTPLDFGSDDVSKALYSAAAGNKDVEDRLMQALIDRGTFHSDTPSTRDALRRAAAEVKTKVDAQVPANSSGIDPGIDFVAAFKTADATANLYSALFSALERGDTKYAGIEDPLLIKYKAAYAAGEIKSAADLKKRVNADAKRIELPAIHQRAAGATPETAKIKVKADGVVRLTQVRSQLEPKADIPQTKTPDEAATVEHTVTPAPVDIAIGSQDYKALSVAAVDAHTNQIIQDMSDSGLYSPEELQFEVDNANKLASLYDELRICPTGQAEE